MAELDETLESVAKGPKSVSTDGTRVEAQGVDDVIKADQHLAAKQGVSGKFRGLRYSKLTPPGPTA
ncbi:MAG TPA: hypothetical protein PKD54_03130 [Pirellulaceae bacterium]|nr:hypothetical protein [Pirellulaceae bacterium]